MLLFREKSKKTFVIYNKNISAQLKNISDEIADCQTIFGNEKILNSKKNIVPEIPDIFKKLLDIMPNTEERIESVGERVRNKIPFKSQGYTTFDNFILEAEQREIIKRIKKDGNTYIKKR